MSHGYPSIKRGWEHERLGFPDSVVKTDKVRNGCWLTSQQYLPQKGSQKHAKVTDNLGSYNKSVTDPDPVNPVSPVVCFFFFYFGIQKEGDFS